MSCAEKKKLQQIKNNFGQTFVLKVKCTQRNPGKIKRSGCEIVRKERNGNIGTKIIEYCTKVEISSLRAHFLDLEQV